MKFPQTKRLEEDLNKKGKICLLPISYAIEFVFIVFDKLFTKREDK